MTQTVHAIEAYEGVDIVMPHEEFLEMIRTRYVVPEGFHLRMTIEDRDYAQGFRSATKSVRLMFERVVPFSDLHDR